MTLKKPKTFWTCLVLFIAGVVIAVNIIQFNYPDFTPLASFALLTGIGFIVACYGLWILKNFSGVQYLQLSLAA